MTDKADFVSESEFNKYVDVASRLERLNGANEGVIQSLRDEVRSSKASVDKAGRVVKLKGKEVKGLKFEINRLNNKLALSNRAKDALLDEVECLRDRIIELESMVNLLRTRESSSGWKG